MTTKRKTDNGKFVQYEHSGAVSIRLKDYLRSPAGKEQLETMKEMRTRETLSQSSDPKKPK